MSKIATVNSLSQQQTVSNKQAVASTAESQRQMQQEERAASVAVASIQKEAEQHNQITAEAIERIILGMDGMREGANSSISKLENLPEATLAAMTETAKTALHEQMKPISGRIRALEAAATKASTAAQGVESRIKFMTWKLLCATSLTSVILGMILLLLLEIWLPQLLQMVISLFNLAHGK